MNIKVKLFNLLSDKGYIKVKTPPRVEQRLNNDKKQKLNRYRALTEQLYRYTTQWKSCKKNNIVNHMFRPWTIQK